MCTKEEAILKIEPKQLDSLLHPQFDPDALKKAEAVASGLAASPGAACGGVYFTAASAKAASKAGPVLLVRNETSPEDIEGMAARRGHSDRHPVAVPPTPPSSRARDGHLLRGWLRRAAHP